MKQPIISKMPLTLCSCLAILLLCFNVALAQEKGLPKRVADHHILMKHLLNLSSEQVEAIKTIRNSYKEQITKERENIRRAKQVFRRTAESSNDVADIHTAYAPVAEAMKNMAVSRILMKKEIDNVLTAQQIEKAKAVRAELLKNKPKHHFLAGPEWE